MTKILARWLRRHNCASEQRTTSELLGLVDVSVSLVLHELQPAVSDLGGRQSQPERGATLSWDRGTATTNTAPLFLRYAA